MRSFGILAKGGFHTGQKYLSQLVNITLNNNNSDKNTIHFALL